MMGTWFLATSLGNLLAGLIAGWFKADAVEQMPVLYLQQVIMPTAVGILLILLAKPIKSLMSGIQ
jgi:POT family proton-dependent oligopeptide transporter